MHSQLNIKYPQSPWLYNTNNLHDTYKCRYEENRRSIVLKKIIDTIYSNKNNLFKETNNDYDYKVVKSLSDLTSNNINSKNDYLDKNHHFHLSTQTISRKQLNTPLWLNFHTTLYSSDINPYINREYTVAIKWCLLPLSCDIERYIQPIKRDIPSIPFNISKITNNDFNNDIHDSRYTQYTDRILNIRNNRISKRNLIKRQPINKKNKKDNIQNIDDKKEEKQEIDVFKFINDTVSIKNVNGILKFIQLSSGKIKIIPKEIDNYVNFITVILYDNKIHITLHTINII